MENSRNSYDIAAPFETDKLMRPEDQKTFFDFIDEISRESDRGLALIGAAFIDEKLAATLIQVSSGGNGGM